MCSIRRLFVSSKMQKFYEYHKKNIKRELNEKVLTNQNTRAYTLSVNDNNTDSKGGESHETE